MLGNDVLRSFMVNSCTNAELLGYGYGLVTTSQRASVRTPVSSWKDRAVIFAIFYKLVKQRIVRPYQTEQMLKDQDMQFEPRLMKSISQYSEYLLFNCQKVCPIKLITELWALLQNSTNIVRTRTRLILLRMKN